MNFFLWHEIAENMKMYLLQEHIAGTASTVRYRMWLGSIQ